MPGTFRKRKLGCSPGTSARGNLPDLCLCKREKKQAFVNAILQDCTASLLEQRLPAAPRRVLRPCAVTKGVSGPARLSSWGVGTAALLPGFPQTCCFSKFSSSSLKTLFLSPAPSCFPLLPGTLDPCRLPRCLPVLRDTRVGCVCRQS